MSTSPRVSLQDNNAAQFLHVWGNLQDTSWDVDSECSDDFTRGSLTARRRLVPVRISAAPVHTPVTLTEALNTTIPKDLSEVFTDEYSAKVFVANADFREPDELSEEAIFAESANTLTAIANPDIAPSKIANIADEISLSDLDISILCAN